MALAYRDPRRCRFPVAVGAGGAYCACGRPLQRIVIRDPLAVGGVRVYWRHRRPLLPRRLPIAKVMTVDNSGGAPKGRADITEALQPRTSDKVSIERQSGGWTVHKRRTTGAGGRLVIPTESELRALWGDR